MRRSTALLPLAASLLFAGAAPAQTALYTSGLTIAGNDTRFEAVFDANADGIDDIVGWWWDPDPNQTLRVTTFLLDGAGGATQVFSQVPKTALLRDLFRGSASGDLDGDGAPELLLMIGRNIVRLEAAASGVLALQSVTDMEAVGVPITLANENCSVLAGDVTGDGVDDLVLTTREGVQTWTLDTQGSFQSIDHHAWPMPFEASSGRLADFDDDGWLELAVHGHPCSHFVLDELMHFSLTGGLIGSPVRFPILYIGTLLVAAGDLDGDGDVDVTAGGFPFLNDGAGNLAPAQGGTGSGPNLVDVDGDGDVDSVGARGSYQFLIDDNEHASTFRVSIHDGAGSFGPGQEHPGLGAHQLAGITDFDGDGDLNIVAGRDVLLALERVGAAECAASVNSTGIAAVLSASGSASVGRNDLVLTTRNLPPGQNALTFFGPDAVSVPLGNGTRCVGGPIVRLGVATSDPAGRIVVPIDLSSPPANVILAGDVLRFQTWFRDPAGGGARTNLSSSGRILFMP